MVTMVVPYAIKSYTVVVHEAEEGGYWGEVLELPGCVSQGETIDVFRSNIREALEAVLASESEEPQIRIYPEPVIAEKGYIKYDISESSEQKTEWFEAAGTWTAIG
jgi:predicted RNase H-like HicB family nuclease